MSLERVEMSLYESPVRAANCITCKYLFNGRIPWQVMQGKTYSDELVGNNLDTNELGNLEKIISRTVDTKEEGEGIEEVTEDELNSKLWGTIIVGDAEVSTPPAKETVG